VEGFQLASSVAVYSPAEVFYEDNLWLAPPSKNDWFAGWAKRMGELQIDAYQLQYDWDRISIVRPSNVYGPYDNFDLDNAMVIPSLIRRAVEGENPFVIWGDGSAERDFIHAKDVARGMILVAESGTKEPVNLGAGAGVSIRKLVEIIVGHLDEKPEVRWDTTKPAGDRKRIVDITRARAIGYEPQISLEEGIGEVIEWFRKNRDKASTQYALFNPQSQKIKQ
jgi:GDP-L-fucose synthase